MTPKFNFVKEDKDKIFFVVFFYGQAHFLLVNNPTLGLKTKKQQKKKFPTEECLGVGPLVQTVVSPYSPADQQAQGGDWLGGAGATKDPLCSFRG